MAQFREYLKAIDVMKGAAALLNDPEMTDYTSAAQLIYLNMAIAELNEHLIEADIPVVNETVEIPIPKGDYYIQNLPIYLAEIQEVGEREAGRGGTFIPLGRRTFPDPLPITNSLCYWCWENQRVIFNPLGANGPMEVQVKYLQIPLKSASDENTVIGTSNALQFLTFKTAALLSLFVGENPTRASVQNEEAEKSLERYIGISNKGKQQIMTRHRPFRAAYKTRGW